MDVLATDYLDHSPHDVLTTAVIEIESEIDYN